jgi:WD40 repeat protein
VGPRHPFEGHTGSVNGALLLPDGRRALSWSYDNTLRLWDLLGQREVQRYIGDDPISAVVFSRERRLIVAGDARGAFSASTYPMKQNSAQRPGTAVPRAGRSWIIRILETICFQ